MLYALVFTFTPRHNHNWLLFPLWLSLFIPCGTISLLFSSSILDPYWPKGLIFQCPIFLPFCNVHGVLKARMLKWFAIPFSSGPWGGGVREKGQGEVVIAMQVGPWATLRYSCPSVCSQDTVLLMGAETSLGNLSFYPNVHLLSLRAQLAILAFCFSWSLHSIS